MQTEIDKDKKTGISMDMVTDYHQKGCHHISFALAVPLTAGTSSPTITQGPSAFSEELSTTDRRSQQLIHEVVNITMP